MKENGKDIGRASIGTGNSRLNEPPGFGSCFFVINPSQTTHNTIIMLDDEAPGVVPSSSTSPYVILVR
jgi:hypothetical protein